MCLVNFMDRPLYPWERMPVPIEEGAVWSPEPIWTFWKREHLSPLPEFESRTVQAVASQYIKCAIPVPLHWLYSLHKNFSMCFLFPNSSLIQNTQKCYETYSKLLPECTVTTAVKITCKYCGKYFWSWFESSFRNYFTFNHINKAYLKFLTFWSRDFTFKF